jgi:hypothetical protein
MNSTNQSVCVMEDTSYVYHEEGLELLFYLEDVKSKGNIDSVGSPLFSSKFCNGSEGRSYYYVLLI